MTDDAFLDALALDPLDDVTRAVYADWLEERGDPRAAYLRAELNEDEAAMRRHAGVDEEWAFRAGRRWDVVLLAYPLARKIPVIKAIRQQRYIGLAAAKALSEEAAPVILPGVPARLALEAADRFRALQKGPPYTPDRPQTPDIAVRLRPAGPDTARPPARGRPYRPGLEAQRFLRVTAVRPGHTMAAARAVASASRSSVFMALEGLLGPLPLTVADATGQDELSALAGRIGPHAGTEVLDAPHGAAWAEWTDVCLGPISPEDRERLRPHLLRACGYGWPSHPEPYLRRLPRFFAEEVLVRLSAIGPFYPSRSEDQP